MQSRFPFGSNRIPLGCKKHLKIRWSGWTIRTTGGRGGVGRAEAWGALTKPGPFYMQVPSLLAGCVWRVLSCGEAARLAGSIGTPRKSISVASQRGKLRVSRVRHSPLSSFSQETTKQPKKITYHKFLLFRSSW